MLQDVFEDCSFLNIGNVPSAFIPYKDINAIYARPFRVKELSLIHLGSKGNAVSLEHIIRVINICINVDVKELTDGDFGFVAAWLRMNSFPKTPLMVTWDCTNSVAREKASGYEYIGDKDPNTLTPEELQLEGIVFKTCGNHNNEIVHNATFDLDYLTRGMTIDMPETIDFPRVATLVDYYAHIEDFPEDEHLAMVARWIKAGATFKEKLNLVDALSLEEYEAILRCKEDYKHDVFEKMTLSCRVCQNKVPHIEKVNPRTVFADNSEKTIMDIQYSLLTDLKMQPDEDMPAKKFLYYNSCLAKDKREEAERQNIMKSARKRGNKYA